MKKMKRIAAITAALLICSGAMGYMPAETMEIGGIAANAAEVASESVEINEANFPDAKFRQFVAENFDTDGDGALSAEEIEAVTEIKVSNMGISDLTGIEHFTALESLHCASNQLTSLDLSNNPALEVLYCSATNLTTLDLSYNAKLKELRCEYNNLTSLNVNNNPALEILGCGDNQLTSIDLSSNPALKSLNCYNNELASLDVSSNPALATLDCFTNQITSLDVSKNTALTYLQCGHNNLTSLDLSNNEALEFLTCYGNQLTSLDLSNNIALETALYDENNYEITVTGNTFDLSTLPTGFDAAKTSSWTNATVEGNILTIEDVTKEITYIYNCGNGKAEIFTLIPKIVSNPHANITEINETNFPDAKFRQFVAENFDKDDDGALSAEEIEAVTEIDSDNMGISDLTGIQYFENLTELNCSNNKLTALDMSGNKKLVKLTCSNNQISVIDLSNNTELSHLTCELNQITNLDLSNNPKLMGVKCNKNKLTELDLSKNRELTYLACFQNNLAYIDVSHNNSLTTFQCSTNHRYIKTEKKTFDLSKLAEGFDASKTFDWVNGKVDGNILTVEDISKEVSYKYDCGNNRYETFVLFVTLATGDVNNDSTIDSIDASSVLAHYAAISTDDTSSFSDEQIKAADVNKDQKCDSIDASLILAYYGYTSTGGTDTIEEYLANANAEEQLKALKEKKESEVQLFAAAYIGCTDDMNEVDATAWIKENSPVFYKNYSFVKDIPSGQIAGTPMGELYCIVPFDENSTVAINSIVQDENGNGSYENVIYRSESGEPVLLFCNNSGVDGDTMVTITDSDGNKDVWFPGLDEKLMLNCPYNANYDTFVYDFTQYQEILEKEHTSRKNSGWGLMNASELRCTNWAGVDYRGSEIIGTYQIEFGKDTAYIKWVDGDEEHEFKDVEWQLEFVDNATVVTFNFNEFAGILQYNFLWNENNSKLYTAVNFTNEDTLDENLKLYRILDRYEYSEPIS